MCAETFEHQLYSMAGPTGQPRSFHAMVLAVAPARLHLCQSAKAREGGLEPYFHLNPSGLLPQGFKGGAAELGQEGDGGCLAPP